MKILLHTIFLIVCCFLSIHQAPAQGGKKGTELIMAHKTSTASIDESKSFKLPSHFNGYNAQMLRGPSWHAEGFIDKVTQLHPSIIRYPGGTVASYWDWKTGWLKDEIGLRMDWKSIRKNPITLEDIKFACDSTGAVPLFVLNMMTSDLDYQMEMLKHAKRIGLPVLYVELDNEIYLGEEFYVKRFPTGVAYAKEANTWINVIKKEFPDVKIAVVGNSSKEGAGKKEKRYFARTNSWNRDVLSVIKNADGMTFHVYGGTGLNFLAKVQIDDDEEGGDKAEMLQELFNREESTSIMLGIPFLRWRNSTTYDYALLPKNMKPWISEYNLFEKEGVMAGTWVHGLYAVTQTLLFFEDSRTELICYHNLTTSAQFAAIFNNEQGFGKAVKKKSNAPFNFTAAGYGLSLAGKAIRDGEVAKPLKFSNNVMIRGARGQEYPSLYGWVITHSGGKKIIVINLGSDPVITNFSGVLKGNVTYSQIEGNPKIQVASDDDIKKKSGVGATFSLPSYSVTLIEGE